MWKALTLIMLGLGLSACQALAAAPAPAPIRALTQATSAPTPTWPPTWTPTAVATLVPPTATPRPTDRPTALPTDTDFNRPNVLAALPPTATPRSARATRSTAPVSGTVPLSAVPLRVFAVGDSVMLGAVNELKAVISGLEVDAQVSRHVGAVIAILQERRATDRLGEIVVVHIGDNGYFKPEQFDQLMDVLSEVQRVVFVNLKEPRKWEESNNQLIAAGVARYPSAVLADWRAASIDHPEYFARDGIHLGREGARAYAALIAGLVNAP